MKRYTWQETADRDATYWRVTCTDCGFTETKASRRNVELCQLGHARGKHPGQPMRFTVTPLVRVEAR